MLALGSQANAAPVYGGFFGTHFLQAGNLLVPYPPGAAAWECWVNGVPAGESTSTTVRTPLAQTLDMAPESSGAYIGLGLNSSTLLNLVAPPGTYEIVETLSAGGTRTNRLTLSNGTLPPRQRC